MVTGVIPKITCDAVPETYSGEEGGAQVQPEPEDLLHSREPSASTRQWGERVLFEVSTHRTPKEEATTVSLRLEGCCKV